MLKPTAAGISEALRRRGAFIEVLDASKGLFSYSFPGQMTGYFVGSIPMKTSRAGVMCAHDKRLSRQVAKRYNLNVPTEILTNDKERAEKFLSKHRTVVVKPLDGARARDVTTNISTSSQLRKAITLVEKSSKVLIQAEVGGNDVRALCVDGKFVYSFSRLPATVIGDGKHNIAKLVELENVRRKGDPTVYEIDTNQVRIYLGKTITGLPRKGEIVRVCGPCNFSLGGMVDLHPRPLPRKIEAGIIAMSKELGLAISAYDFMVSDYDNADDWVFIEVNSSPAILQHRTDVFDMIAVAAKQERI